MSTPLELNIFESKCYEVFRNRTNEDLEEVLTKPKWLFNECSNEQVEIMVKVARQILATRRIEN